jgi:hypothetical protein
LAIYWKVGKKKQNPYIFLAAHWNLSQKSDDLETFFSPNLANLGFFFMENPFYRLKSYFSGQNLTKFHTKKKKKTEKKFVNENLKSLKYSTFFNMEHSKLPNYSTNKVLHYNISL